MNRLTIAMIALCAAMISGNETITATGLDPSGYALYSATGNITLNNMSASTITGNVRSEGSTCTLNNLSSFLMTGNLMCAGTIRINNISSGRITGLAQSAASLSIARGFTITGGSTVVNSMSALTLSSLAAPSGTSDANYLLPITIVTGDYTVNSSVTLNGTIYATGNIHINSGNISGTGSLVAGGAIHLNNISSLGSSSAKLFLYALGSGGIDANNISSATIRGTLYAPNGTVTLDNISTLNITGGVFGRDVRLNNISSLTLGAGSNMTSATPPGITNPITAPAAPSNLSASAASFTSVALTWVDNSNNETSFRIERSPDGVSFTDIGSTAANTASYVDSGLTTNTTYYYRVRARNSAGDSAYTNIASATLLSPPNAPSSLSATAGASSIDLAWLDNSSNETSFRIERGTDGSTFTEIGSVASGIMAYADASVAAGTTYYYRVKARNSAGDSDYSNTANASIASGGDPCDSTLIGSGYNSEDAATYLAALENCGVLIK